MFHIFSPLHYLNCVAEHGKNYRDEQQYITKSQDKFTQK
jgi:hypothetical protein